MVNPPSVFRLSNAMNDTYRSHVGRIIRGNYTAGFRGRPEILDLGRTLYEALQGEGLTALEAVSAYVK